MAISEATKQVVVAHPLEYGVMWLPLGMGLIPRYMPMELLLVLQLPMRAFYLLRQIWLLGVGLTLLMAVLGLPISRVTSPPFASGGVPLLLPKSAKYLWLNGLGMEYEK